jgi:hypothetical protein
MPKLVKKFKILRKHKKHEKEARKKQEGEGDGRTGV